MRWIFLVALALVLSGHAIAQDVPTEGSTVKGNLVIGRSTFALPPGEWKVVATSSGNVRYTDSPKSGANTASAYLVQLDAEGTFVASLFHRVPLSSSSVNYWRDSLCDRKDTLYRDAYSGSFDYPECLLINHSVPFWVNAPTNEFDRRIWDWYQKNKVKLPKTALGASYRKYFSGDYVAMSIYVNPEAFGQDPSLKLTWADSEWHPLTIKNDPKRSAFVENFKKWSYVMADNAKSTPMDRKPKSASLPALDELKVQ